MKSLQIVRAKPNPAGKDLYRGFAPAAQLAAEWIDFKNVGSGPFPLNGVTLYHVAYQPGCRGGRWQLVMSFRGSLNPGQIVRVHSGSQLLTAQMNSVDVIGATFHLFTSQGYIWNNDCSDAAGLANGNVWLDTASYDPNPPEGRVLVRLGDKLVPSI